MQPPGVALIKYDVILEQEFWQVSRVLHTQPGKCIQIINKSGALQRLPLHFIDSFLREQYLMNFFRNNFYGEIECGSLFNLQG